MIGSYDSAFLALVQAVTPVHAGVGGRGHIVDLPVQRDFTGYPCIWGSSFKGALRSALEQRYQSEREHAIIEAIFGPPQDRAYEFSGCVVFSDLKLLAIPGPCGAGICYLTSLLLLNYLKNFVELAEVDDELRNSVESVVSRISRLARSRRFIVSSYECLVGKDKNKLIIGDTVIIDFEQATELGYLFLQLFRKLGMNEELAQWLSERVVVVPETIARELIGRKLLQCVTRIALDYRTKTVRPGALWSEEYVPELTIFTGLILASKPRSKNIEELKSSTAVIKKLVELLGGKIDGNTARFYVILGGHETIGKGIVRVTLIGKFTKSE